MRGQVTTKEDIMFMVQLCEKAGRYEEMRQYVKQYILDGYLLSSTDRELFTVVYKNVIGVRRNSWKSVRALKSKCADTDSRVSLLKDYQSKIESEISAVANEVLELITKHILPTANGHESKVYYIKLKADYERYLAEISTGKDHSEYTFLAHESYKDAADIALCFLSPINVVRLGLMLNFSVFYYEIYNSPERACILSRSVYDDAMEAGVFSRRREETNDHKDAVAILQMMKDNLKVWTSNMSFKS